MCVLAIWLGVDASTPLVVGANRDEAYARPSAPPSEIEPGIIAGRDLESGGTWLGYNRRGLFVAVTNRRSPPRTAESFSRGLMTLDALRCGTIEEVDAVVTRGTAEQEIAGFSLVAIAGDSGVCFEFDGALRRTPFGAGAHVVSSDFDLNDPRMPETQAFRAFVGGNPGLPSDAALRAFLSSHDGARPICKHGAAFGTVSSMILRMDGVGVRVAFADGAPCTAAFH